MVDASFRDGPEGSQIMTTLSGKTAAEVNDSMRGFADFYTEYLIRGKAPAQAIRAHPAWQSLWYDEPEHQHYIELQE